MPLWYHTIELPDGTATPGWFDLRSVVGDLPWPDVRGKRCLDVGTYDGFYAFELERRGAAEVVATDIGGHDDWDLSVDAVRDAEALAAASGEKGLGFEIARRTLGSRVRKRIISVYDLSPERVGTFDVVICGSLMLHLRDPISALEAIRSVCGSWFLSVEEISLPLSVALRRRPVADMRFSATPSQWWVVNTAGHRRMVEAAGFQPVTCHGPFSEPYGEAHSPRGRGPRAQAVKLARRLLTGADGVPHHAVLARPRS